MKDIFVDNCAAKNFENPLDIHYKNFISWLMNEGVLVVSQKLLVEYGRTCGGCAASSNIVAIVGHLTARGRLIRFKNSELKKFSIPKYIARKLLSNHEDHVHIKVVIFSHRKYAITADNNLRCDLNNYPGYAITAVQHPKNIPYN